MSSVLIDTQIWVWAYKSERFAHGGLAEHIGRKARALVETARASHRLLVSRQLAGEIFFMLTETGIRMKPPDAEEIVLGLLQAPETIYGAEHPGHLHQAMGLAAQSKRVQIWDYLVYLPFYGQVDELWSADPDMHTPYFQVATKEKVSNPIKELWSLPQPVRWRGVWKNARKALRWNVADLRHRFSPAV